MTGLPLAGERIGLVETAIYKEVCRKKQLKEFRKQPSRNNLQFLMEMEFQKTYHSVSKRENCTSIMVLHKRNQAFGWKTPAWNAW